MTPPIDGAASDLRERVEERRRCQPDVHVHRRQGAALRSWCAAEAQVAELRLRVLAAAGDLADSTAAKDAAGWLAHATRTRFADTRADLGLAESAGPGRGRCWRPGCGKAT